MAGPADLAESRRRGQRILSAIDLKRRASRVDQGALRLQEGKSAHVVYMAVRQQDRSEIFRQHLQSSSMAQHPVPRAGIQQHRGAVGAV